MADFATLELQWSGPAVATVWLNRPDKNNAFDGQMIDELRQVLAALSNQSALRLLVLRGRGQHFSAGADLAWMRASAALDYEHNALEARALAQLMAQLAQFPAPTLAVVQGAAFAGAVGLVSCCDLAIGSESALFCLSEVRLGLVPAVVSPYVVQAIGRRAARRYMLTGDRFDAPRAQALGLLAEVYPDDALASAVEAWVTTLLNNGPAALRACKHLLAEVGDGTLSPGLQARLQATIAQLRTSEEGQEGMRAFLEKRRPAWRGNQP